MPVCSWCLLDGAHIGETCENLPLYVESRQSKLRERMGQLDGLMEQMDSYGDDLKAQPEQLSGHLGLVATMVRPRPILSTAMQYMIHASAL